MAAYQDLYANDTVFQYKHENGGAGGYLSTNSNIITKSETAIYSCDYEVRNIQHFSFEGLK